MRFFMYVNMKKTNMHDEQVIEIYSNQKYKLNKSKIVLQRDFTLCSRSVYFPCILLYLLYSADFSPCVFVETFRAFALSIVDTSPVSC